MHTLTARAGLTRTPWLTIAVLVVTAVPSIAGDLFPTVLHALERTPAGLHGEWWRWVTSLVVQDGGVAGTVFNLVFLVAVGVVAEQVAGRRQWAAGYLLTGLLGQVFGHLWQPVGGGNSVAVCGLAGIVAVAALVQDPRLPRWAPLPVLLWSGALLAVDVPLAPVVCVVVAVLCVRVPAVRAHAGPVPLVVVVAIGVWLAVAQDIHGGALLVGLAAALVLRAQAGSRYAPTQRPSSSYTRSRAGRRER